MEIITLQNSLKFFNFHLLFWLVFKSINGLKLMYYKFILKYHELPHRQYSQGSFVWYSRDIFVLTLKLFNSLCQTAQKNCLAVDLFLK